MKKWIMFVLILMLLIPIPTICYASNDKEETSATGLILQGQHELMKMFKDSYFQQTNDIIAMCWKTNEGSWIISNLSLEQLRFVYDDYISTPYIKFKWKKDTSTDIPRIMKSAVIYVEIHCKQSDWLSR